VKKPITDPSEFELLFFSIDSALVENAVQAGVDGVMVDWENQGKKTRQLNFDTQINHNTYDDLVRIREIVPAGMLLCRINGFSGDNTFREIDLAARGGADELFVPMVNRPEEVETILKYCNDAIPVSILIETKEALNWIKEFAGLPLKRVYVGLNDLHIQQGSPNIFYPLMDHTISDIRSAFDIPVGVGGVTYPLSGLPIASSYLIKEYARLRVNFSFLRRTFIKDCSTYDMAWMVGEIKSAYRQARLRSPEEEARDLLEFRQQVSRWVSNPHLI